MLSDSLMNNGGDLRGNDVTEYEADESALRVEIGEPMKLDARQFERLSKAFLADLDTKFVK